MQNLHAEFQAAKVPQEHHATLQAAAAAGFSWLQLLTLVMQFGPTVIALAPQILADLKSGNVAALQALIKANGPQIVALIQAVASLFGITVPPLPAS